MRIISKRDRMIATALPNNEWHMWTKGTHTVNVWRGGTEIDCYTFAWEKNKTTMLDFTSALEGYLADA